MLPNEAERLSAVHRYDILDTPRDGAFDRIASLAETALRSSLSSCGHGNAALALQSIWDEIPESNQEHEDDAAMLLLKVIPL